jgi:hypothetical protein
MSNAAGNLGETVKAMRPMVPAKDYETSKRFYLDLGFRPRQLADRLFEMQLGTFSFILQDYYVEDWANNFVMHVLVTDLDWWWQQICALDLPLRRQELGRGCRRDRPLRRAVETYASAPILGHVCLLPSSSGRSSASGSATRSRPPSARGCGSAEVTPPSNKKLVIVPEEAETVDGRAAHDDCRTRRRGPAERRASFVVDGSSFGPGRRRRRHLEKAGVRANPVGTGPTRSPIGADVLDAIV